MNEPAPDRPIAQFKDRSTGLVCFGILDILLGVGCVLLLALMALGQVMATHTTGEALPFRLLLPSLVIYSGLAAAFVWLGIGSITKQRWARGLLLILSWSWLVVGVVSEVAMIFVLPGILRAGQANAQGLPPEALAAVVVGSLLFMGLLMVVVPGTMVFFYGSRHVKATCESHHPQPCWTDACPLPVLAVTCWLWLGGLSLLLMSVSYNGLIPCFGTLLTGLPGTVLCLAFGLLWFWLGWMFYRLRPVAWWILVVVLLAFMASGILTFSRIDLMVMYQKMGYPESQLEIMRRQAWMTGRWFVWWMVFSMVPMLGYLVWVKRLFNRDRAPGDNRLPQTAA